MLDNISLALQSLRSNKMRALLTMLGIIIGIGAVIAIKTVGNSLTSSVTDSFSGYGISNITVYLTQKKTDDSETIQDTDDGVQVRMFQDSTPRTSDLFTDAMLEEYRANFPDNIACIELTESAGSGTRPKDAKPTENTTATVMGVNDDYFTGENVEMLYGRAIQNTTDAGRRVCVVSDRFVSDCMSCTAEQAIGKSIDLTINKSPYSFYIVGVYHYDDSTSLAMDMSTSDDVTTNLYLPLSTAQTMDGSAGGYSMFTVVCTAQTDATAFLNITKAFFQTYYTRNDSWTADADSLQSLISTITSMLDTISLGISAIAAISLLVGGIGVMNIMLVSITERTREIGTRKALGAPQNAIRMQFIVESVVICLVGGMIGILVGLALGGVASKLLGYAAHPDAATIAIAVGFSMAIGVFFGYYPANKAAKLDPIEALRYE
ncbi:MAG: ABC transporter permease [Faecalibacterium sp.]|nr:ABC transporter permease [Faecalibacterium sp.]